MPTRHFRYAEKDKDITQLLHPDEGRGCEEVFTDFLRFLKEYLNINCKVEMTISYRKSCVNYKKKKMQQFKKFKTKLIHKFSL